jgi:nicotinamide-nucleotide amidase
MAADDFIHAMATTVGALLTARSLQLVTAESCTGGWVAKAATDIAGSSGWFERGFVTYSNDAKVEQLGVSRGLLNKYGAVSEEAARAMVEGALIHSRGDIAVAITGIAGPEGGSSEKPVGTVWIAWGRREAVTKTAHYVFSGSREAVRRRSVSAAFEGIARFVE